MLNVEQGKTGLDEAGYKYSFGSLEEADKSCIWLISLTPLIFHGARV